ncbi:Hsp20/alpha crystallin family protein [Botryobacter ruber]|uniref:Hsp20/alpha crystallin family protein n=1 Tax=Botryobacter ruber TaxID=2171629 RepID=UPI000E0C0754|nr:Hsp20/alpha crystallin family protein [Botryobacter ruber]
MALTRFNGVQEGMPQSFSSMLDRFFNESVNTRGVAGFTPHVDICENEKGFEIELALPGVKQEEVNIDFQEGNLTISGERKLEKREDNSRYHMLETQYGSFSRTFHLPDNINPEEIKAQLSDGILRVSVPKDEHKTRKRQIKVTSGAEVTNSSKQKNVTADADSGKPIESGKNTKA